MAGRIKHMEENKKDIDALKLGNELTLRRYLFNKTKANRRINEADYIVLHIIWDEGKEQEIYDGKTYLKDLSEKTELTIRQTSKLVSRLNEQGLVKWSHDGDGKEGTYVTITDQGIRLLEQQQDIFKEYYGNVIEKFGKENLIVLLNLMKQLETVMRGERERMEGEEYADREDE